MTINQKLVETLRWYQELGINIAVGEAPANHTAPMRTAPQKGSSSQRPQNHVPVPSIKPPAPPLVNLSDCKTLEDLRGSLGSFEGCPLKKTATNLVFADGNPQAKVMLVGEAPGADEDRQGVPFVGVSGQLLDRMLATIGLDRTTVYITRHCSLAPAGKSSTDPPRNCRLQTLRGETHRAHQSGNFGAGGGCCHENVVQHE